MEAIKTSKARLIINAGLLLTALAVITYFFAFVFYTKSFEFYLSKTIATNYNIFGVVFVSLLSGLIVYIVAFEHELSHWLSAKILNYRNKMIGAFAFGIGGFFVDPEMPLRDRASQILTGLYGSIIPIFTGVILLIASSKTLALMTFNGVLLNPSVFYFQMFSILFFFIAMLLGVFNLFPIIKGNDGYNVVFKFVFKNRKHRKAHLFASQFISFALFLLVFNKFFYFNGWYLIGLLVILILTNIFMHFFEKSYKDFKPTHSKSGFYRGKYGVIYYYFATPSLSLKTN